VGRLTTKHCGFLALLPAFSCNGLEVKDLLSRTAGNFKSASIAGAPGVAVVCKPWRLAMGKQA
jgi:hypothetical protein